MMFRSFAAMSASCRKRAITAAQTLGVECCNNSIRFSPGHNLFIADYNTEHYPRDKWFKFKEDVTFEGTNYYPAKVVIGLCHPVVSYVGYQFDDFSTNDRSRVVLLELQGNSKP
jgi:hypothetical protein